MQQRRQWKTLRRTLLVVPLAEDPVQQQMNPAKTLRIESRRPTLTVNERASLRVCAGRMHCCPSTGAVGDAMLVESRLTDALMMDLRLSREMPFPLTPTCGLARGG